MPASERYGRKGQEVTKGKYEKDHFSSGSDGVGGDGRINRECRREILIWISRAGRERSRAGGGGGAGSGVCGARACGLRSAGSGGGGTAGGVFRASLLRSRAGSLWAAGACGAIRFWFRSLSSGLPPRTLVS